MDADESQPTQPATQQMVDPRRFGGQNSGFSDEDITDIICLLVPFSPKARQEAARLADKGSPFVMRREEAGGAVDYDYHNNDPNSGGGSHMFVLRLSSTVKDLLQGFTFGRNGHRCDVCFTNDAQSRLSNVHFRIFLNQYGVLMLQDQSTNGTIVDEVLLRAWSGRNPRPAPNAGGNMAPPPPTQPGRRTMSTLSNGTKVGILLQTQMHDLEFIVRIPRREGALEQAYQMRQARYLRMVAQLADSDGQATMQPGIHQMGGQTGGHTVQRNGNGIVNVFAQQLVATAPGDPGPSTPTTPPQTPMAVGVTKKWTGSGRYNVVGEIGKGAFATVVKVTAKHDGRPYAAKELDKQRFIKNGVLDQKVDNEMRIMQQVQHNHIVRYIEHFDFDERWLILVMEFVDGGDLGSFVRTRGALGEETVRDVARQMLSALCYLHDKNITHRDIKPDNILIDAKMPFTVKLTDFGLSKMVVDTEQTFLKTFCGTVLYCAPEVYYEYDEYDEQGRRTRRAGNRPRTTRRSQRYDHACDIWSLGGVLFYCLAAAPPYPAAPGSSYTEVLQRIMTQPLNVAPLREVGVSEDGIAFLSLMLQRRPELRATAATLLQHPWLAGGGSCGGENEENEENLEQRASQLTISDELKQQPQLVHLDDIPSDDEILDDIMDVVDVENDNDDFLGTDSQVHALVPDLDLNVDSDESSQQQQPQPQTRPPTTNQRLFGEVAVSAVGSSGVLPEEDLLAMRLPPETPQPSFNSDDDFLSPRVGEEEEEVRSVTDLLKSTSQDTPKGAISQPIAQPQPIQHLPLRELDHTASFKRKPLDTSDEHDSETPLDKPSIKRFKSESHIVAYKAPSDSTQGEDPLGEEPSAIPDLPADSDDNLYASIPPIGVSKTGRHIDLPVHKSVFWTPGDPSSWHLQYPEMTQLPYGAFVDAAAARHEEFRPGRSPLWDLAMKHFPPTTAAAAADLEGSGGSGSGVDSSSNDEKENTPDVVPLTMAIRTAAACEVDDSADGAAPAQEPPEVARFESVASSAVQNILLPVTDAFMSWGRGPENTLVHAKRDDVKVPKYALKLLLWRDDDGEKDKDQKTKTKTTRDLRPWLREGTPLHDGTSPEARRYHFYVATKARGGLLVNRQVALPSADPAHPHRPARHWIRLHDGDSVVVWNNGCDPTSSSWVRTELVFRCTWGGSSLPRSFGPRSFGPRAGALDGLLEEEEARPLDDLCLRFERARSHRTLQTRQTARDAADHAERSTGVGLARERQRAVVFAELCAAAAAARHNNKKSTVPLNHHNHHNHLSSATRTMSAPSLTGGAAAVAVTAAVVGPSTTSTASTIAPPPPPSNNAPQAPQLPRKYWFGRR